MKLKRTLLAEEKIAELNKFNLEWQLNRLISYLLNSTIPIDKPLAIILIKISDIFYFFHKLVWWVRDKSPLSWLYWKLNMLGMKLKIREPINYVYEFSYWNPNKGRFDDFDFDDVI